MKKKIIIVYSGARYFGGIERYLSDLFLNYDQKSCELVLVSMGEWELVKTLKKNKKKVIVISDRRARYQTVEDIVNITKKEKANLIVSQGVVANFYARLAARKTSLPHLTVVHSDIDYDYPDYLRRFVYQVSDRVLNRVSGRFIAVSEHLKSVLIKRGIEKKQIDVIYNGLADPGRAVKNRGKEVVIGSIGRLHYAKNYHNLILAMKLLPENAKLIVWGEGEERLGLEELIKKEQLEKRISLAGFTEDLAEAYRVIDIYIQPSISEGFGLTVASAMLSEKPIVVTQAGSLPELITDGKTGILADGTTSEALASPLKVLIDDPKLANKLAKKAREEALERFNLKDWSEKTIKIFLKAAK